jgi:hypothetical protein
MALLTTVAGVGWILIRALDVPETSIIRSHGAEESRPEQRAIDGGSAEAGIQARSASGIRTLTERDVNALLAGYLATRRGHGLTGVSVSLAGHGIVDVSGRTRLGRILGEQSAPGLVQHIPESWRARAVWLRVRGPLRLEVDASRQQRRALRLEIEHAFVGRQRVPVRVLGVLCRLLLRSEASQLLRWSLPASVEMVTVEPGRVVIRTVSSRQHSGVADHR